MRLFHHWVSLVDSYYEKNSHLPTASNAFLMCSIVGSRFLAGHVMATTSKRAGFYSSRRWRFRNVTANRVSRRCFCSSTASAGWPASWDSRS